MRTRYRTAAVAAAFAALIAAGCGGDGDSTESAEDGGQRVVIEAREGAFNAHEVFEAVAPGVVTISSIFDSGPLGDGGGQGSGFVLNGRGEIATNAHVVTDGDTGGGPQINEAAKVYIEFADRNRVEAEIIGWDPHADVALLKVDPDGLELNPVALGSNENVRVGDPVAAIGSPFGVEQSLSVGVVSARDRTIPSLSQFRIDGAIQTDASINPGNSGGPLIDAEGRVIGLNQQINTTSGGDEGVGFAVPIDLAKRSIDDLREDGKVSYAYIGVTTQALYPQLAERLGLDVEVGALVAEIIENGPADEAGIRGGDSEISFQNIPEIRIGGDVIVSVDGSEIVGESDLARVIAGHEPGDEVEVEILRDGERETVTVRLGDRDDAEQPPDEE